MKKLFAILFVAFFAFIGSAIAEGTRNVTLTDSGWIRYYTSGGMLLDCDGFSGWGEYYASVTNTGGDVIGWMAATTGTTFTLVLTNWETDSGEVGYGLGSEGAYLTEMTAATNSFVNCSYIVP